MGTTINRRQFVAGGIVAGALGASCAGMAVADETAESAAAFETTVSWDAEYDVIVVGFGGAGAAAAITAADAGAKTLLLEKAPKYDAGGNSNVCYQWMCYVEPGSEDGVRTYFEQLRGDFETPSDAIFDVYIKGMGEQMDWLNSLGASNCTPFDGMKDFADFEGVDSHKMVTVDGNDGMSVGGGGGAAYKLFQDNVEARSDTIDVWYEAPAKHLIQDPATKIIHGVIVEVDGEQKNVRAKNGVVLACGGFENNPRMQQNYTQRVFWPSLGRALYNEGDGITMALEVNAALWHMSNVVSNNHEFVDFNTMTASFSFGRTSPFVGLYIGPDGTRVHDGSYHHGKQDFNGEYRNASMPNTHYYIWDQAMQDMGPVNRNWSADSSWEIEHGWIFKADTLEELGRQLGMAEESLAQLSATVEQYNQFCADGFDPQYQRSADTMLPVSTAPFYGLIRTPTLTHTQGGPERNEKGEVLDVEGNPIPHLYETGELGDIWSNLYQASNNLGGGQIFGRISGANAAAVKDDVIQDDLLQGEAFQHLYVEPTFDCGENQYIGRGRGKSPAGIFVRVTMDGDAISNVEIVEQHESDGLEPVIKALESLPQAVIDANGTSVDAVAGATRTYAGFLEAVNDALAQAKA